MAAWGSCWLLSHRWGTVWVNCEQRAFNQRASQTGRRTSQLLCLCLTVGNQPYCNHIYTFTHDGLKKISHFASYMSQSRGMMRLLGRVCVFFFWKVTLTQRYIAAFIDPAIKQLHCFSLLFSTLKYDFFPPLTACFLLRLHLSTFIFYYAHTERRKSDGDEGKHWTEGGKQTDRVDRQIARAVCVKLILTCPNSSPSSPPSLCLSYKLLSVCFHRLKRCCRDRLLAIRASANLSFIEIVLIPSAKTGIS